MERNIRSVSYVVLACVAVLCNSCQNSSCPTDCSTDQCDVPCVLSSDSLYFGDVTIGETSDQTFVIENVCESTLAGTVSVACDEFSVIGAAIYDLSAGDSAEFTVRFSPTAEGSSFCTVETGSSECADISCCGVGTGSFRVVFSDDFEDGNREGWLDHDVCSSVYSYSYNVVSSPQDTSMVLKHQGGVSSGGGNGEAYVANGVNLDDVSITANIRNVAAYHTTAKAVGLTVCLNEATGVQYLAWHTVAGDLFVYETSGWLSCGPTFLAHVVIDPIGTDEEIEMKLSARGGLISVWVNGSEALSYDDSASPLPAGAAGLVATAGITYFDNVLITTGYR